MVTRGPAGAPRTAFVLAGGAALGAMQAGMVHALYEHGIMPDLLTGTSAGALNAAFLASRPATVATAEALAVIWRGLRRMDVLPLRPPALISGLAGRRDHLVPDLGLRQLAARHLQFQRLEQAAIPLHLVAFDLSAGHEVLLSDGPAADAVLAAAAIPGVLPPVRWRGRLLADGGIANNTPISHAVALGAERIYVLPTEDPADRALPKPPRGALAAAVHAITLLTNARLHDDLVRYASAADLVVLPAVNPRHIAPTDFGHAGQLITLAQAAARTVLTARAPERLTGWRLPERGSYAGTRTLPPASTRQRGPSVPWGLRPAVPAGASAVLLAVLLWSGAELLTSGGQAGLAERLPGGLQTLWPVLVTLSCRLSRPGTQPPGRGHPRLTGGVGAN